jgi:hypothetical protein
MGKETIITKGCKLLLDAFQFVSISSRNGIPNDIIIIIITTTTTTTTTTVLWNQVMQTDGDSGK